MLPWGRFRRLVWLELGSMRGPCRSWPLTNDGVARGVGFVRAWIPDICAGPQIPERRYWVAFLSQDDGVGWPVLSF